TEVRDKFGRTPLIVATIYGHPEVIQVLLVGGASMGGKDVNNMTAYSYARVLDRTDIMQLLRYARHHGARR
ncbi:MAG: ankyrin repeat domain-containing protein, partial [Deltaproteobacteria bacterium]|nr:ankyrin repeat domain-containing protein [Deltaproteobacteria bacterium]